MFLIPKKDLTVIDPALMNPLPPEGRDVGTDFPLYWLRHIQDGSVEQVEPDKVDAAKANAEKVQAQRAAQAVEEASKAVVVEKPADQKPGEKK